MRIVIDTNVLLAGLATRGLCEAVLNLCIDSSDHTLIISDYLIDEFAEHYRKAFGMSEEQTRFAVGYLREQAETVTPAHVPLDACRDPDDLPILGTALAGKAECLVTGDQDLLVLKSFQGIRILSPRALYEQWKS